MGKELIIIIFVVFCSFSMLRLV
uniref:Uncharacterized protein n=1 Tax=Arundo donax TaxID=35708 RepID=A0A0A9DUM0_ARUDO